VRIRSAAFSLLLLAIAPAVFATPIFYNATFRIDDQYGAAPAAEWGDVSEGSLMHLQFGYDSALAVQQGGVVYDPSPFFTYQLLAGNSTIGSGSIFAFRSLGSDSFSATDQTPTVCTPGPCGTSDWLVDEIFFGFSCASWAAGPQLLADMSCSSTASGNLTFELFGPVYHDQAFGVRASLVQFKEVPEPATLGLFGLGMLGAWFLRRTRNLSSL